MELQIIIAVAVVAALAYFFVFKKKAGDVNQDGAVNADDVKVVAEKVEAKVEAAAAEVTEVVKKVGAKTKSAAKKATGGKRSGGGKPSEGGKTQLK